MEMPGSNDSEWTISSVGSAGSRTDLPATGCRRFTSSSSKNTFLTPAFSAAASSGRSISGSPLNVDPSLLRFTQSRLSRLHLSSSTSSNDSPDSPSFAAAAAARKRLQYLLNLRSLSSSSSRGSAKTPMSPIENFQAPHPVGRSCSAFTVCKTPMKLEVEEDVLVMDAVSDSGSGSGSGRARLPLELLSYSSVKCNSLGITSLKSEICRSWDDGGICRFGSRCQFAHGKEELRGPRLIRKPKTECSAIGSCVYGNRYVRYLPLPPALASALLPKSQDGASSSTSAAAPEMRKNNAAPAPLTLPWPSEQQKRSFLWPPTEAEEDEIQRVLYEPSRRRRLPVFMEICPSTDQ